MPKVSAEHLEARRRQILDAARVCFARRGFHQTSIQDIYRQAELSPGAVYRYFRGKDDIIEALCEESSRQIGVDLASIALRSSWSEVLDELECIVIKALGIPDHHDEACIDLEVWGEAVRNPRIGAAVRRTLDVERDLLAELVRRAQERGEVGRTLDPAAVAATALVLFAGLVVQRALDATAELSGEVALAKRMLLNLH
ncbi:MAG: TetR/AcrR family transcriptional regulator [Chloroflexi bacterium]|nr:TetR/AcrR family transcriptional regulator [Chloroflexota bacterium]